MAISFVGAGTVVTGSNPTVGVPSGALVNDLLLLVVTASVTPATPTGWARLAAQGSGQYITVFYKFLAPGETDASSFSLTMTSTAARSVMVAYRGASGVEVVPAVTAGTGTTMTPNTVTTTYANDFVISIYACGTGGATTLTRNASTTQRSNTSGATSTNGLLIADELKATAGVSTARAATLSVSRAWSSLAIGIVESPRTVYWVGGNGTWDATSSTNWSNSSGGSGGFAAPGLLDTVVINANSGSPTVTLSGQIFSGDLNTTGATCTLSSTGTLTINGSMTLSATTTWSASSVLTFVGTGTVTTNAVSIASPITLNGASQTLTLGDNLTTTGAFTLTAGTLALGTNSLNAPTFSTNNSNTRAITFGSGSAINLSGNAATVWAGNTATGFSTTGTPTVNLTFTGATGTRTIAHGITGGTETTGRIDFAIAASATDTVTLTNSSKIKSLNVQHSGTFDCPSSLTLYGSLTIASSISTYSGGTGTTITLASTGSGNTVTLNKTITSNLTFNGVGGSWTLGSNTNLTLGTLTVTNGTFSTGNQNITAKTVTSSGAGVRTVTLGSSTLNLGNEANGTIWDFGTTTNLTFDAGTSQINSTNTTTSTFTGGGLTYYNLNFADNSTLTIEGSNTFNTLSCSTTTGTATQLNLTAGTTQTVTNFNVDGSSVTSYVTLNSSSSTVAATLSKASGTVSLSNARIEEVAATGGATWNAFGCQKRSALATGWNFGTFDRYLVINAPIVINFTTTGYWSTTSGGATTAQPPYIFDTAILDNGAAGGVTIDMVGTIGTLNVTDTFPTDGLTAIIEQVSSTTFSIYGSCRIPLNTVWGFSNSFVYSFESTSSGNTIDMRTDPSNINTGAFNGTSDVTFNGVGGEWTLLSNFGAVTSQQIDALTFLNGTLNTGSYQINCNTLSSTGTNTAATLNLSASTVTVNTALTVTSTTTTLNAGTSTVVINRSGSTAFTFNSNKTFNVVQIGQTSGTGTITISGSPTISRLSNLRTGAYTLAFTASTTTTIGTFDVRGTAGNVITVASSTTTNATLASQSSAIQSNIDYLTMNYITATPAVSATGATPYYWYIGSNSTTNVNTTGVIALPGTYRAYHLTSGTSWSVPADWNDSSNNVYLLGGGGGGSGSVVASSTGNHVSGAGGGGGGFTALTNVSLTPSGTAAYAIGAAGSAGSGSTSSSTAGNGGTTTFIVTNTAGGGGGGSGTTTASTAGTAGTGTTFNGGAGGAGTAAGNVSNAGAGGGGSGGLQANGVNGGTNTGTTRGNGGAGNGGGSNPIALLYSDIKYGTGGLGGTTTSAGVVGTIYGSGGGGGGTTASSATTRAGATGTQGAILIAYEPPVVTTTSGNFLTFFYQ